MNDADADPSNELQTLSVIGGELQISNGNAIGLDEFNDADADPNNEIQSLTLNGTEIQISAGNTVDLAPILPPGGSDDQLLSLNGNILMIEGGNSVDLSALAGNGGTDDQLLTLNGTTLQIEGGNSVDLSPLQDGVNDADADPSNELQDLNLFGTTLQIENGNNVDLSALQDGVTDADADPSNELQNLTLNGTEISLSDGNTVDLAPIIPPGGSDNQSLTLNGTLLQIEDGNSVDLSALQDGVNDADADPQNELQDLTLIGTNLQIENGNTVNLGILQDGVVDADADPNNELQNLTLNGNTLEIDNGNSVDLSALNTNTLWTPINGGIYTDATAVGIGTDSPVYPLTIENTGTPTVLYMNGIEEGEIRQAMAVHSSFIEYSEIGMTALSQGDTATFFNLSHDTSGPLLTLSNSILNYDSDRLFQTHLPTGTATGSRFDIRGNNSSLPALDFTYFNDMPDARNFLRMSISDFNNNVSLNWSLQSKTYGDTQTSSQVPLMSLNEQRLAVDGQVEAAGGQFWETPTNLYVGGVVYAVANENQYAVHADHSGAGSSGVGVDFAAGFHGSGNAGGIEAAAEDGFPAIAVTSGNVGIGNSMPASSLTIGDNPSRFFLQPAMTVGNETFGGAVFVGNNDGAVVIEKNSEDVMVIGSEINTTGIEETALQLRTTSLQIGEEDLTGSLYSMQLHHDFFGFSLMRNGTGTPWELYHNTFGDDLEFYFDGMYKGEISAADGMYLPSDRKLKDQVRSIGTVLPSLMELNVCRYRYIHGNKNNKQSLGFIAQEVQEIFPELVKEVKREGFEGNLTMNYTGFGVLAVKAIQEQQEIIDEQAAKIEDLEARLSRLEMLLKD